MVEQKLCPNCGQEMDLSNLYLSGKAACTHCGFRGLPLSESSGYQKIRKMKEETQVETRDPLDLRSLFGKLTIVWTGVFMMSLPMPEIRSLAPVSVLGILIFGLSYKLLGKK